MKKFGIIILAAFCISVILVGCQMAEDNSTPSNPSKEYHDALEGQVSSDPAPVNYMDEIKQEIHDELFRDETEVTKDIVERIFKHLEIETIDAFVDGDEAVVLMSVTTINAGQAWINGLEKYAVTCAENLFSETYVDDATLYECYLEEFEDAVRAANYIKIPVAVEMDYENHRWIWDIDDDVINAITGFMLAAIDGDINSATPFTLAWLDEDIADNFDIKIELDPEIPWSFIF